VDIATVNGAKDVLFPLEYALEMFVVCLVSHILLWRSGRVRNLGAWLAPIFLLLPVVMGATALAGSVTGVVPSVIWSRWAMAYILHLSLSGSYILVYTAVAGFSPSIAILKRVEGSMPNGLPRDQLAPFWFKDENLTGARRENLLAAGFITESNGMLCLSTSGVIVARGLVVFRRFLGLPDIANG
jgi:hypothetical protein